MTQINLNAIEQEIFAEISRFAVQQKKPLIPRIAGGWVRDKLLGKECNDVDIVLDTMSGLEFAQKFTEFAKVKVSGIGVIKANPDKSKHLEAATVMIQGMHLDFLQLRTEDYSVASRIPTIEVGDPTEDAFRRDITINALFYNILSQEIEDFTGMGLNDLKSRIIRTPLDPVKTFIDDPLRILRVFRFASMLDYQIDPIIYDSLSLPQIHEALKEKVSNERVGIEMQKMLQFQRSEKYLLELLKFDLVSALLKTDMPQNYGITEAKEFLRFCGEFDFNTNEKFFIRLYILLAGFTNKRSKYKGKEQYSNYLFTKNQFAWPNSITNNVRSIEKNIRYLLDQDFYCQNLTKFSFIKHIRALGELWKVSLIVYCFFIRTRSQEMYEDANSRILDFIKSVKENNLEKSFDTKCLLDGNVIVKNFPVEKREIAILIETATILQIEQGIDDQEALMEALKVYVDENL